MYFFNKKALKFLCSISLFCCLSTHAWATDRLDAGKEKIKTETAHISWVRQYPEPPVKQKHAVLKRMMKMVIGEPKQFNLIHPVAITASSVADFEILDQGTQAIFEVKDAKDDILKCFRRKDNNYSSMAGVCSMPTGEILFTDSRLNKVYKISADKKHISTLNDSLKLSQPTGIVYATKNHEIWVVETGAHRISILNDSGVVKKTFGERGDEDGQFNYPISICMDKQGNVYVVDAMNFRVQVFDEQGNYLSKFGQAGDASGFMARPKGIAVDTFGNIYVVDALFNAVQLFDRKGNLLYSFGSQGSGKEEFWMPSGIFIDDKNNIYVADTYNSRIQVFKLNNE